MNKRMTVYQLKTMSDRQNKAYHDILKILQDAELTQHAMLIILYEVKKDVAK